jgi:phosphoglycolate phosphatase
MVGIAFGVAPGDARFEPLKDAFLARYAERLLQDTRVFDSVQPVLDALDAAGLAWGIVTNKAMRFAAPLVDGLGLAQRARVVIAGDTTPHAKPHPAPLLEAARRIGVPAGACAYIGDDLRDVQAGRAAGMATLAAAWGYLGQGDPVHAWGADRVLPAPADLLQWLELA